MMLLNLVPILFFHCDFNKFIFIIGNRKKKKNEEY